MSIVDRLVQFKTVAVAVIGFIKRRPRASIAAAVGLLIVLPLLRGSGGEAFFLNLVGLGIAALVMWRIMRAGKGKRAHCRCNCNRQKSNTQRQGGNP